MIFRQQQQPDEHSATLGFLRNLQCGASDAGSKARFWADFSALEGDASALTIEREWVREEGLGPTEALQCRPGSVDFLVETVYVRKPSSAVARDLWAYVDRLLVVAQWV